MSIQSNPLRCFLQAPRNLSHTSPMFGCENLAWCVSKENQIPCWDPAPLEVTKGVERRAISREGESVNIESPQITGRFKFRAAFCFSGTKKLCNEGRYNICLSFDLSLSLSFSLKHNLLTPNFFSFLTQTCIFSLVFAPIATVYQQCLGIVTNRDRKKE